MTDTLHSESLGTPLDEHFYKLVEKKPVRCNLFEYAAFIQSEQNRIVAQDKINGLLVSTVFTGIDYAFGDGKKKLFETLVFGLKSDIHPQWRHSSWENAISFHQDLINQITEKSPGFLLDAIRNKSRAR